MSSFRSVLLLCVVPFLLLTGCGMKRDLAVEEEIQARYALQDAAFSSRNPSAVTAYCAKKYTETNKGLISDQTAPSTTVTVSTKGRVRSRRPETGIASLSEYNAFLAMYFGEVQSVNVRSRTTAARVNDKKDRADVTLSRDVQVTLAAPEGRQAMSVIIQETLSDTWVKDGGKEWMKSDSDVDSSIIKRDRVSENE
ncbi:MAG: hypothetical protein H7145_24705 [Akkermansiaceae bacterium]|nr:hypothetical protein [Armatimonadota bacterium]